MSEPTETLCTAFDGDRRLASGALPQVALAVKMANGKRSAGPLLIFDDANGRVIDIDTRGSDNDMLARIALSHPTTEAASRGKGRPKLGVVAREITLLPRHWEWLSEQPGGASVMLRKLVDEARRSDKGRLAQAKEAAYRFMSAMAGNLPHFEEAVRALFANDQGRFESLIAPWPPDIRDHFDELRLAISTDGAFDEHANRHVIFANPVDAPGEMIFGAERSLHEAVDNLGVGERFFFGALAGRDGGILCRRGRRGAKHDPDQHRRDQPYCPQCRRLLH